MLHATILFCPKFFFGESKLTIFSQEPSLNIQSATQIRLVTRTKKTSTKKSLKNKIIKDRVSRKQSSERKIIKDQEKLAEGVNTLKAKYLNEIRELIDQKKHYPRLSQRMGHTGEVLLGLTIHKSGKIEDLKLLKKCPFKKLNLSALKTLKKIAMFNPFPEKLALSSMSIKIPIIYNLR